MAVSTYYKKGEWKVCCDCCGKWFKSGALGLMWNGTRFCFETCFEMRNAQELLRMPRPERAIPWARNCQSGQPQLSGPRSLDSKLTDRISTD
jgi:hypothetical protein